MVQQIASSKLGNRTARLRLPIKKKPYFVKIDRGLSLGYRRNEASGTWVMRVTKDGNDWTQAVGKADDHETGPGVLTYGEAQTRARELARGGKTGGAHTVAAALDRYHDDLASRGGAVSDVSRARGHIPHKLSMKAVASLTREELKTWRDSLRDKIKPASVNRVVTTLRAALNLAAEDSAGRIANREAWRSGLKAIGGAGKARNVILSDADVHAIIGAAYRKSDQFGLLIEVLVVTGARTGQALRLQGEDVQAQFRDPNSKKRQPRLMMPVSNKGRGEKAITHRPVPISASLADRLTGRTGQLLRRPDGESWAVTNLPVYFDDAIAALELTTKARVTMYALRHTSIVRQLLAGVPIRVVAALHDTSVKMIEQNYSEHIADHADELARPALLETLMAEVITLRPEGTKS
jgi:integrase